jgi:hypothetical protein
MGTVVVLEGVEPRGFKHIYQDNKGRILRLIIERSFR